MHTKNGESSRLVGPVDQDLAIETTGTQQGRVENFGAIGGRQQYYAAAHIETVQLGKQLVECLFLFILAAAYGRDTPCATECIQFVDEDDARRMRACLLEQIAYACRAYADKQFHEFRAADREKRHAGFASHGKREQRFASTRWAYQQHAFGHMRTQASVALR